jgi:C1A family cysteine protease
VPSRLFIYYNERLVDNDIAVDGGAYLRDGIKTLNQLGVCTETDWPYVSTAPLSDGGPFPAGSPPVTKPDPRLYANALQYKITSYQRLTPTLAQLQGCLASGYPLVFL